MTEDLYLGRDIYICVFITIMNYIIDSLFFFLMIRRPPRSTLSSSSAASDVYKRQINAEYGGHDRDTDVEGLCSVMAPGLGWAAGGIALSSTCFYAALFLVVLYGLQWRCCWKTRVDWSSRIVSNVQCVVSGWSAVHILLLDEHRPAALTDHHAATFGVSESREFYMLLFVGYLVYDLLLVLHEYQTFPDPGLVIHHILILAAYSMGCLLYTSPSPRDS
eukprot:TRINITY_DN55502_c0_g1_i1.p1 TRINITY_DN55502_c0_g1~~TRINITY_DN55502_c0_g1_i1.p1  ORF type:complete len:219 (-),score=39.19 TRINITY_DN55502_c0_g1_i1:155-811(-)